MEHINLLQEAKDCRLKALTYVGLPEAALLLRLAKEFEHLNAEKRALRLSCADI